MKKQTIEDIFKEFKPPNVEVGDEEEEEPQASSSHVKTVPDESGIESMIKDITEMFPHLGDGKK